ncbi:MAG: hypothetical protein M5U01_12475 [Ardenticatenaceae bacterium]|nr:hypothetical protein [Ardenticatenaceae bacterium]HBY98837.1 hypothetical protein [Chloroflexota bacterium]
MSYSGVDELEQAIRHLPAIFAVRVFRESSNGSIEKVHVLAAPERPPKKVVRDIETLLLLKFNLRIDYRKISLVQLRPEDLTPFIRPRVKLEAVDQSFHEDACRVTVILKSDGRVHQGVAEGPANSDILLLATQATLEALNTVVAEATLTLNVAEIISIQNEPAVFVSLTAVVQNTQEKLLGSCFIQDDNLSSTVRATLDAVNRRFFTM